MEPLHLLPRRRSGSHSCEQGSASQRGEYRRCNCDHRRAVMRRLGWFYLLSNELPEGVSAESATAALVAAPGVTDAVPSYDTVFVEFDTGLTDEWHLRLLVAGAAGAPSVDGLRRRTVVIPTLYGGAYGVDLEAVARTVGVSQERVVELHAGAEYQVVAMGFMPGFAFMSGVPEALRVPRRAVPRAQVPAHSVAIANGQAGVYPLASPGGWNLLGTALTAMYDPHRSEPFLLRPGDAVRFEPAPVGSAPARAPRPLRLLPEGPRLPTLLVAAQGLLDLVVDEGRFQVGRFGLARSGPLDARCARLANLLIGNPAGAAVVELTLTGPVFQVLRDVAIAVTGDALVPVIDGRRLSSWTSLALRRGQVLSFEQGHAGARAYLALAGGIEAASYLGSRSADLRGLVGGSLSVGDVIGTDSDRVAPAGRSFRPHEREEHVISVRLEPGPQASPAAMAALTSAPFAFGSGDRTGIGVVGHPVPGGEVVSQAAPIGAVQVTPAGFPIVLLSDRGTLGGYHKPAVVHQEDLGKLAQLRPHQLVRFVLTEGGRTAVSSRSRRDP